MAPENFHRNDERIGHEIRVYHTMKHLMIIKRAYQRELFQNGFRAVPLPAQFHRPMKLQMTGMTNEMQRFGQPGCDT